MLKSFLLGLRWITVHSWKVAVQQACGRKGICRNGFQDTTSSHKDTCQVDGNAYHDIFAQSLSFLLDAWWIFWFHPTSASTKRYHWPLASKFHLRGHVKCLRSFKMLQTSAAKADTPSLQWQEDVGCNTSTRQPWLYIAVLHPPWPGTSNSTRILRICDMQTIKSVQVIQP